MARMPSLHSHYRDRALCRHHRGGTKSGAYKSCTYRCCRRSHCRWRERDGLCASLHGRFIALRRGLVRWHDRLLHLGRRRAWAAPSALVTSRPCEVEGGGVGAQGGMRTRKMHQCRDSTLSEKSWLVAVSIRCRSPSASIRQSCNRGPSPFRSKRRTDRASSATNGLQPRLYSSP